MFTSRKYRVLPCIAADLAALFPAQQSQETAQPSYHTDIQRLQYKEPDPKIAAFHLEDDISRDGVSTMAVKARTEFSKSGRQLS